MDKLIGSVLKMELANVNPYKKYTNIAEVQLPDLSVATNEKRGGGILGAFNMTATGQFQPMQTTINYTGLAEEVVDLQDTMRRQDLFLGVQQDTMVNGTKYSAGTKIYIKGYTSGSPLGTITTGSIVEGSVTIETDYIRIIVDGKETLLIDQMNEGYRVNGKDVLPKEF